MNNLLRGYVKIPCPECGAAVGEQCAEPIRKNFSLLKICTARARAYIAPVRNMPRVSGYKCANGLATSFCKRGAHKNCRGQVRFHGSQIACPCKCHKRGLKAA
jgi:hypothetical protein